MRTDSTLHLFVRNNSPSISSRDPQLGTQVDNVKEARHWLLCRVIEHRAAWLVFISIAVVIAASGIWVVSFILFEGSQRRSAIQPRTPLTKRTCAISHTKCLAPIPNIAPKSRPKSAPSEPYEHASRMIRIRIHVPSIFHQPLNGPFAVSIVFYCEADKKAVDPQLRRIIPYKCRYPSFWKSYLLPINKRCKVASLVGCDIWT